MFSPGQHGTMQDIFDAVREPYLLVESFPVGKGRAGQHAALAFLWRVARMVLFRKQIVVVQPRVRSGSTPRPERNGTHALCAAAGRLRQALQQRSHLVLSSVQTLYSVFDVFGCCV